MAFPDCDSKKEPKRDRDDKAGRLVPDHPDVPKPESERKKNAQLLEYQPSTPVHFHAFVLVYGDSSRRGKGF